MIKFFFFTHEVDDKTEELRHEASVSGRQNSTDNRYAQKATIDNYFNITSGPGGLSIDNERNLAAFPLFLSKTIPT